MDIEILEACKENVQPLKRGRNTRQLGLALQAEVDTNLHERLDKERGDYELAIITYDGPDPLQPRLDYIEWMEQTHIKHGKDCNLTPLLEDTITLLKDNDSYRQDPRFIQLIVKYIEAQENAVELFQMVYSQGLGTMCAVLYKTWADVLDLRQDFKRADQVYQLGIANRAQPLDMLKESQAQFQLSVGRSLMLSAASLKGDGPSVDCGPSGSGPPLPPEPRQRQVLGKLKKDVGSVRRAHGAAGILASKSSKSSSKKVTVFQDPENNYEHLISSAMQRHKIDNIASSEKRNEENIRKAGTWNKGYSQREVTSRLPSVSRPSFSVHEDPPAAAEEEVTPKHPPKTPSNNVLKARKADLLPSSNAMDVFGSAHSARKAMQSNLELYSGGREFSFEELRAAYYTRKNEKGETFQTPMKKAQISLVSSETPRESDQTTGGTEAWTTAETPSSHLKRVGFMPLTPSEPCGSGGLGLGELGGTPLARRGVLSLHTPTTTIPGSRPPDTPLPTIDENAEMGDDSSAVEPAHRRPPPPQAPIFGLRKKQLFSNEEDKKILAKKTPFTIFSDDD